MKQNLPSTPWRAAEFFAGIGLARYAMAQSGIQVVWSNDISAKKYDLYKHNFDNTKTHTFVLGDLGKLNAEQLPSNIHVAWASFPCTDLSLAGRREGIHKGQSSSTFWHFIKALSAMGPNRPLVVVLENVSAFATSHSGKDISNAISSLNGLGYSVDVLNIDTRHFIPQSRPRLFIIGSLIPVSSNSGPSQLRPRWLSSIFDNPRLITHQMALPEPPPLMNMGLSEYLEPMSDSDQRWWSSDQVHGFINSLSDFQNGRFITLMKETKISVRTAYRRMRNGTPRWEMRPDEIAGCLRTTSGGSSKQAIVRLGCDSVAIRWMTPREYGALMGVPRFARGGLTDNQICSAFGDAVSVPVVRWLTENYLVPLLTMNHTATPPVATHPACSV